VRLFNASEEICAQLRTAKLAQFFDVNVEESGVLGGGVNSLPPVFLPSVSS
jgi:hypothetical protein